MQAIPDNEFALSPASSSVQAFRWPEITRARGCRCARCRRDRHSAQSNEMALVPRRTAAECIQERSREYRTRFLLRPFVPALEYCFRNRRSPRLFVAGPASPPHAQPSSASRARCIHPDFSAAARARPRATSHGGYSRSTSHARWSDP